MKKIIISCFIFFFSVLLWGEFYSSAKPVKKYIALTFDDGPSRITPQLCDLLKNYQVKATFFVLGENVKRYPQYLKRIKDDGHLIGSHTYHHKNFYKVPKDKVESEIKEEIKKTEDEIYKAIGVKPTILRYPYGYSKPIGISIAKSMGYDVYNWTFGYDWNDIDLDKLVDMYVKNIKPGAILLLHDTEKRKGRIIELTKRIIENAKSQGYEILRLDEMIFK